jgi:membrane protein implicated in regulation of membrane protease activity
LATRRKREQCGDQIVVRIPLERVERYDGAMASDDRTAPLRYVASALPGWVMAGAIGYGLQAWAGMPVWVAVLVPVLWIAGDALTYPARRRFYLSEPPSSRMIGESGIALTPLQPDGLARLRGEIWQARAAAGAPEIPKASRVTVRAVEGLRLIVEAEPPAGVSLPAGTAARAATPEGSSPATR